MRFLIDADLPRDSAAVLVSYGHVEIDVRDKHQVQSIHSESFEWRFSA